MRRFAAFLLMLPLASCFEQAEKTRTIGEYLSTQTQRTTQLTKCKENCGDLADTSSGNNATGVDDGARLRRMNKALGG